MWPTKVRARSDFVAQRHSRLTVVYNSAHDRSKVALICGGGAHQSESLGRERSNVRNALGRRLAVMHSPAMAGYARMVAAHERALAGRTDVVAKFGTGHPGISLVKTTACAR